MAIKAEPVRILGASENAKRARVGGDPEAADILELIERRKESIRPEQDRFKQICDRYDNLYYANELTTGGADHWPEDPNRRVVGKAHVSVNVHPTYVDVPAALQSVPPIENIKPSDSGPEGKVLASAVERLYFAWKDDDQFETKAHKVATTKSLYGRAAAKVIWDEDGEKPTVVPVEQPRNLWMGYTSSDYSKVEWACYSYLISPNQAVEEYGLDVVEGKEEDGEQGVGYRYVYVRNQGARHDQDHEVVSARDWLATPQWGMLEVNDFWVREPKGKVKRGKRTTMQTRNIITVGNYVVKDEVHKEYDGELPYVPVFNTFIPGVPDGRPDLYDVEQLLREKDERVSAGGTMVGKLTGNQFWQLTGPEAPDRVPSGLKPEADRVISPGAGNRIEPITPWMPEFQLEQYLARIDRELQDVSGLNDLLRGLAPSQVLSSGKAINALVANYEARITLRRQLFYQWRKDVWDLVKTVWGRKVKELAEVLDAAGTLVVKAPSLTPRDDIEQATMALNLLNGKVWTQTRAMDATGVDDPEGEQDEMRKERQDPSLFPADVQAQAALMAMMQQMQMTQQQMQGQQQAPMGDPTANPGMAEADEARRQAADEGMPQGEEQMQGEGEQGVAPPGSSQFEGRGDFNAVNQTMLLEGQPTNRTLFQQPLTEEGQQEGA